ncbi:[FeFe] hydrogenase H-cluster radical SAM maturase HydE [Halanaerobium salsuginis]|jgi:biotin synthase|uniref:Biotin synthase n=1 Tax=Halanaerobium salsuginis TaxID=29563 RepID=A0A1I4JKG7_9FIRM|nr:[FeFe] hydrogenase H-cluster radical SAM maturase HydE [Halanaerobium salsuginis]SFL66771.1 biotin synthase [Halanaerobium salsuginis]
MQIDIKNSAGNLTSNQLKYLLNLKQTAELKELFKTAYQLRINNLDREIYLRGIIEFSNICSKDCYYCGIRKSNQKINRFKMSKTEILESAGWIYKNNYASIVLQSGERNDPEFINFVNDLIKEIKNLSNNKLGITLSLGEQDKKTYQKWFELGAHRYLLRIESSNQKLYENIHPVSHSFKKRLNCLNILREIGYQVGTGVMIGLPGQTIEDLANDLLFFKEIDVDMVGMGPYVIHKQTPLAKKIVDEKILKVRNFDLALKMIAALRILIPDINIAATTALDALSPDGKKRGLKAGANIIMPVITHPNYRKDYQLYENKELIGVSAADEFKKFDLSKELNAKIGYNKWGDSPHYFKRNSN